MGEVFVEPSPVVSGQGAHPEWLPYLHFGYLPPLALALPFRIVPDPRIPADFETASRKAGALLADVVHACLEPGRLHVIPLSGGLDSRALLAAALEAGVPVDTVTFGTPGCFDYEHGNAVARAAGVRHRAMSLREVRVETEALVGAVVRGGGWTYVFHVLYNRLITELMGRDAVYLSGFLGEALAGNHYQPGLPDAAAAISHFCATQRFPRHRSLVPPGYAPGDAIPDPAAIPGPASISDYERLDLAVRQRGAIAPIVLDPGVTVRAPFADARWASFMLAAPAEWRAGSALYEAALLARWPDLFRLPTTNHLGLGLGASRARRGLRRFRYGVAKRVRLRVGHTDLVPALVQYVDFGAAFRSTLREVAASNLADLKRRAVVPWLDPEAVLREHLTGRVDLSREIQVLVGLEVNLKADSSFAAWPA
jgi:hypothetical protein